jgi:hypothetical protein
MHIRHQKNLRTLLAWDMESFDNSNNIQDNLIIDVIESHMS